MNGQTGVRFSILIVWKRRSSGCFEYIRSSRESGLPLYLKRDDRPSFDLSSKWTENRSKPERYSELESLRHPKNKGESLGKRLPYRNNRLRHRCLSTAYQDGGRQAL